LELACDRFGEADQPIPKAWKLRPLGLEADADESNFYERSCSSVAAGRAALSGKQRILLVGSESNIIPYARRRFSQQNDSISSIRN
jgi:hypothetical protein